MKNQLNQKFAQLQKEINSLGRCKLITGEIFIEISVKAKNYNELEEKQESVLKDLVVPKSLKIIDNMLYRKDLNIYISFKKA